MPGDDAARTARLAISVEHHVLADVVLRPLASGAEHRPAIHGGTVTLSYGRLASAIACGAAELDSELPAGSRILIASRDQSDVAIGFLAALASRSFPLLADPLSRERLLEIAARFDVAAAVGEPALFTGTDLPVF